mgnify:CR=1 FL=1
MAAAARAAPPRLPTACCRARTSAALRGSAALRLRRIIASAPRDADIPHGNLGRSSLRAGGATDWLAAGASREWVMQQGGWMSDAIDI